MRRTAFHRSIIRSDKRLSYPEVDAIFAGEASAEEPWAEPLAAARQVAAALQEAREAKGALEVDTEEPEFTFSREGHVTALLPSEQTESHRLIEHLMIAANEAVATLLETRKLPALYRVHERPEPARVQRLAEQLASLDVPTPPLPQAMTPQQAADAVAEIARLVAEEVRRRAATAGPRSRRWCCARSSRRTTRRATSATPACARRATATSRRRSAATPTSSATARC